MASRTFTINQDGNSRTFTVNTGVGPQGPAGTAGTTSWSGLTGEANHIPFDTTPTSVPTTLGTMSWNAADACLEYAVDGGTISIGKETFDYYTNLSGVAMVDGDIVSIVGATGNRTAVDLTDATDATSAANVIGMVTQGAANNGTVRVTKTGSVHSLNTNGLTEGGSIYVDPTDPGKWTMTRPTSPNHVVSIGVVQVAHAVNGVVDVVPNHQCITAADIIDPENIVTNARVVSALSPTSTIAGEKTFSGQVELTGQSATNGTSAMTRGMVDESALLVTNVNGYYPYNGGTGGGAVVTVVNGQYAIASLGANAASYARIGLVNNWQASSFSGGTLRFDRPFRVRFSHLCNMNYSDTNGPINARVYIGSNGSFTPPNAGVDPYPVNTRGIGIEWRKKVGSYQLEIRLFARNGTSTVAGTFISSAWTDIGGSGNSNGRSHEFYLVFDNLTGTVRLYAAAWEASGSSNPPQRHSATPLLTLSGAGVPTDSQYVTVGWSAIEAVIIGDGVAVPTPSSTYNLFRQTIIMQG